MNINDCWTVKFQFAGESKQRVREYLTRHQVIQYYCKLCNTVSSFAVNKGKTVVHNLK